MSEQTDRFRIPKIERSQRKETGKGTRNFREKYLEVLSSQYTGQEGGGRRKSWQDTEGEGLTMEQVKDLNTHE